MSIFFFFFLVVKFSVYLNRSVFVMWNQDDKASCQSFLYVLMFFRLGHVEWGYDWLLMVYRSYHVRKKYRRIFATREDSDQPALSHSLIRIFIGLIWDSQKCRFFMRTVKTLIRWHRCDVSVGRTCLKVPFSALRLVSWILTWAEPCENVYSGTRTTTALISLRIRTV